MATFNASIIASADDATWVPALSAFGGTATGNTVGAPASVGNNPTHFFLLIQNVTIEQGDTINSAVVDFIHAITASSTTVNVTIAANDADNPSAPTSSAEAEGLVLTTAQVAWNNLPAGTSGNAQQTPDFAAVIQERVNDPNWTSGDSILLVFRDNDTTTGAVREFAAFDHATLAAPAIAIDYTPAGGGDVDTTVTRTISYAVRQPVSVSRTLNFDVLAPVTVTRSISYHILQGVMDTRSIAYHVLEGIVGSRTVTYTVLEGVTGTRTISYGVLEGITSTRTITYDLLSSVSGTRTLAYDVLTSVTSARAVLFNVGTTDFIDTTSTRSIVYDVLQGVGSGRVLSYAVLVGVRAERELVYHVIGPVVSTRLIRYHVGAIEPAAFLRSPLLVVIASSVQQVRVIAGGGSEAALSSRGTQAVVFENKQKVRV